MSDAKAIKHDEHGHEDADDGAVHVHTSSVKFYVGILGALMFFTLLTVGVASIHLGPLNLAVAIVIASIKATLVVTFFMHLKYDNRFHSTIVICTIMFIGVFFAYTMNDTDRRSELDDAQGSQILPSSGVAAPGGMAGTLSDERSHENKGNAPTANDPPKPSDLVEHEGAKEGAKGEEGAKPAPSGEEKH